MASCNNAKTHSLEELDTLTVSDISAILEVLTS
jgi:hypothetical protein